MDEEVHRFKPTVPSHADRVIDSVQLILVKCVYKLETKPCSQRRPFLA